MADYGSVADWLGAVSQSVAAIATGWVIWQAQKTLHNSERAERTEMFMRFSEKYDDIKVHIQPTTLIAYKTLPAEKVPRDFASEQAALQLLALFEREHFLHTRNMVEEGLWDVWLEGIHKHFEHPFYQYIWAHLETFDAKHTMSERFRTFVDNEILNQPA